MSLLKKFVRMVTSRQNVVIHRRITVWFPHSYFGPDHLTDYNCRLIYAWDQLMLETVGPEKGPKIAVIMIEVYQNLRFSLFEFIIFWRLNLTRISVLSLGKGLFKCHVLYKSRNFCQNSEKWWQFYFKERCLVRWSYHTYLIKMKEEQTIYYPKNIKFGNC
jgi:hypothetical protein